MNTTWGNLKYVPKTSWLLWCMIFLFNLWSFSWVDLKTFQYIHLLIIIFFLITLLKKRIEKNSTIFSHWILLFMVLPLLSVPACKILNNQPIIDSLIVYRMHLGWLMYFVLSIKNNGKTIGLCGCLYGADLCIHCVVTANNLSICSFWRKNFGNSLCQSF